LARHGREAVGLSPGELSLIIQARKELAKHGKTIEDAAEFYLDYLERIRRCNVTVADLAKEVLEAKRKDGMSSIRAGRRTGFGTVLRVTAWPQLTMRPAWPRS
jgi:hypothetical protein